MYESPIDITYGKIQLQLERNVCKAVQQVDIKVDKEELIKALEYDRDQYMKGYLDGKVEYLDKIRAEIKALNPVDYVSMSSYEGHRGASDMKDDVLQIIDKYKAENDEYERRER